jgi:hypothetical protein
MWVSIREQRLKITWFFWANGSDITKGVQLVFVRSSVLYLTIGSLSGVSIFERNSIPHCMVTSWYFTDRYWDLGGRIELNLAFPIAIRSVSETDGRLGRNADLIFKHSLHLSSWETARTNVYGCSNCILVSIPVLQTHWLSLSTCFVSIPCPIETTFSSIRIYVFTLTLIDFSETLSWGHWRRMGWLSLSWTIQGNMA